jgi:hypothetical protein
LGVQFYKREHRFIKHNTSRDVHMICLNFKTFEAFVERTIAKKHTLCGAELKFPLVKWPKIWLAEATKGSKRVGVWLYNKKATNESVIVDNSAQKVINEVCRSDEGIIPKLQ